jgi:hypothetical protein
VTTTEIPEFAPAVLRSLPALVPAGMTQPDLALELGLSAHLQASAVDPGAALTQLWAIRQAILEVADMDSSIEPIPFGGRDERLELLNMALYLGNLVERAAALGHCDAEAIVERAAAHPVVHQAPAIGADRRQLRTS